MKPEQHGGYAQGEAIEHPMQVYWAVVKESPFEPVGNAHLFSEKIIITVNGARADYFKAFYESYRAGEEGKGAAVAKAEKKYRDVRRTMARHLAKDKEHNHDKDRVELLIDAFVIGEERRLNRLKTSFLSQEKRESVGRIMAAVEEEKRESPAKHAPQEEGDASRKMRLRHAIMVALAGIGAGTALMQEPAQEQFPTHATDSAREPEASAADDGEAAWSTEGLVTTEDLNARSAAVPSGAEDLRVETLRPELVQKGEGAESAFIRLLPRLGEANVQRLFEQIGAEMPDTVEAQAHVLALGLGLARPGPDEVMPYSESEKTSFVATIVTKQGVPSVELVLNRPGEAPHVILDTEIGVIPLHD